MFIFAFMLSLLNISQIISCSLCQVNEESVKKSYGEAIPNGYICLYDDIGYEKYDNTIPPADKHLNDKNNIIQNKEYIKNFISNHGSTYINKDYFSEIYKHSKTAIVGLINKTFTLANNEKDDIIIECPIKIPDNPKNGEINNIFKNPDQEENIFNIFMKNNTYLNQMSYLYLQKPINSDADIRKKGYKKISIDFNPDDYKGQIIIVLIRLNTDEITILAKR